MSDEFTPDPGDIGDASAFDFNALTAETVEPLLPFEPPNIVSDKAKRKWWQSKKSSADSKPRVRVPVPAMPRGGLAEPMAAIYRKTGEFIMPFDVGCGTVLVKGADDCGKAWEELARRNPAVRRALMSFLSTSAVSEVLIAHAPILAAVAVHHVPAVRNMMEKMASDAGEMFAKMAAEGFPEDGAK